MINLTRPFYLAPVHGEPRHQHTYCEMAKAMGHEEHRMFKLRDGFKLMLDETKAWTEQETDGATQWIDRGGHLVEYATVRERETLADYGVIFVSILISKKGVEDVVLEARGYSGSAVSLTRAQTTCEDVLKAMDIKTLGDEKLVQKKAMEAVATIIQRQASLRPMVVANIVRA
jgi:ribonuclease J